MTHEELVEKVAMEIRARRDGAGCTPWSRLNDAHKTPYRRDAEAAIFVISVELKTVTPEMVKAGVEYRLSTTIGGFNSWPADTADLCRTMLAASSLYPKGE